MAIDSIPPLINAQLNYLLTHSPFSIKVEQMWSGSRNPCLLDRFTLAIPFCLDYIKWDVIYNSQYPLIAPDIIFGPDDVSFHPFHGAGEERNSKLTKNSLSDWNYKDPTRLLSLILELRDSYMAYQKKRVGEVDDDRLKFETSTVISKEGIEMYVSSGVDKSEEVRFAVPLLEMDINKVVVGSTWRHQQKIYLQVIFPVARKFSNTSSAPRLKLFSSSELKALFSTEDFRLPPWLDGMCVAEYLPTLEDLLASQIRDAVLSIEVRRKFLVALAPVFGRPVEADPKGNISSCLRGVQLSDLHNGGVLPSIVGRVESFIYPKPRKHGCWLEMQFFLVLKDTIMHLRDTSQVSAPWEAVHFSLPLQFPKQQPLLMLQSSQHFNSHGAPIKSPLLTEYPWSPRWEALEMAERIFDFLVEECLNFKKYCTETVLQQR